VDVLPDADLARDLGGENRYWRRLFVGTVVFSDGTELSSASGLGGADIVSLNKASADTQVTTTAETLLAEITPDAGKTRIAYIDSVRLVATNPALSGYRTPITVTERSGNSLTDYAVKITLDSSWGGWSYVSSDGSDIFFTDDQENPLYFWIEQWDYANKHAVIWVKVPSIPANGTVTVYMWFGGDNPYASYRDPEQVFMFFDDFESYNEGSVDGQGGWVVRRVGGSGYANVIVYNGRKWLDIYSTYDMTTVVHPLEVSKGVAMRLRAYAARAAEAFEMMFCDSSTLESHGHPANMYEVVWWGWANTYTKIRKFVGATPYELAQVSDSHSVGYYTLDFVWRSDGTLIGIRDGSEVIRATDTTFSSFPEIGLGVWEGEEVYVDWVLVRPYTDPEPSVTVGSSESVGASLFLDARAVLDDGSEASLTDGYVEVRPGESLDRLFSDVWRSVPNGRYVVAVRLYGYVSQEPVAGSEPTARIEVYGLQA